MHHFPIGKLSVETFEVFAEGWSSEQLFNVVGAAETGRYFFRTKSNYYMLFFLDDFDIILNANNINAFSEHPVGQAIVKYSKEKLNLTLEQPDNFRV